MKRILSFFALLVLSISTVAAQTPADTLKNSLTNGAKAIQFSVLSNFTLGAFNGATFAGKWQLSDRRAIRLGFDIEGSFQDIETNSSTQSIDNQGGETISSEDQIVDNEDFRITVNGYYMAYPNPADAINFYTGIGPALSWSIGNREIEVITTSTNTELISTRDETIDESQFFAGLGFILGVEWFINSRISLTSEYGITASYQLSSSTLDRTQRFSDTSVEIRNEQDVSGDRFSVLGNGVRFGLSVYF